jgi:hypothetical protein
MWRDRRCFGLTIGCTTIAYRLQVHSIVGGVLLHADGFVLFVLYRYCGSLKYRTSNGHIHFVNNDGHVTDCVMTFC